MKKQNNAKKVNKPLSKKVAPFVMSTSMVAATFLAAGAPISAAELEGKGVTSEVIEQAKNHGEEVSQLAKSLPGPPEKGQLVSELAKDKSEKNIEESTSDDLATEEDGEAAEAPAEPVAEEDETSDDTAEAPAEPIAEEDETSDDTAEAPAEP